MDRAPDVEMAAAVQAEEVNFGCKPEISVIAHGDSGADAESRSERENFPNELDTGVTYRNFSVRWRAPAWLEDPDLER